MKLSRIYPEIRRNRQNKCSGFPPTVMPLFEKFQIFFENSVFHECILKTIYMN